MRIEKRDFERAEKFLQGAASLMKDAATDHPGRERDLTARCLVSMGAMYERKFDYANAEALLKLAVDLTPKDVAPDDMVLAERLSALGSLFVLKHNYAEAESALNTVANMRRQVQGKTHPEHIGAMAAMAALYIEWGDPKRAGETLHDALMFIRDGDGRASRHSGACFRQMGILCLYQNDLDKAEGYLKSAVAHFRLDPGENSNEHLTALNDLAMLYRERGDFVKALPIYDQELKILDSVKAGESAEYADVLRHAAITQRMGGNSINRTPHSRRRSRLRGARWVTINPWSPRF